MGQTAILGMLRIVYCRSHIREVAIIANSAMMPLAEMSRSWSTSQVRSAARNSLFGLVRNGVKPEIQVERSLLNILHLVKQ
jgi:hypothetical protein